MDTNETNQGAERLLKALRKEVFVESPVALSSPTTKTWRGAKMDVWPFSFDMKGDIAVTGRIVSVPEDVLGKRMRARPELGTGEDPGEIFDKPEGHQVYGWDARASLNLAELADALQIAKEIEKIMTDTVEKDLKGKVATKKHAAEVDPDTEKPIAMSTGIFSTGLDASKIEKALATEARNIRGILPPDVAK